MTPFDTAGTDRLVGSDRVLSVLVHLASRPSGARLDELAELTGDAKTTLHRALGALVRAGLARKESRGRYILGDEFLRLAFAHAEARPESVRIRPVLQRLAERFGETAHYAVLDGDSIVYRAKVDPLGGAAQLTSTVGGRNPAYSTAVGKLLLARRLPDLAAVRRWVGERTLVPRTPRTATSVSALHALIAETRARGYATDAEENEPGVNCIAFPVWLGSPAEPSGAVSVSALAFRTPLADLIEAADEIRAILAESGAPLEVSA